MTRVLSVTLLLWVSVAVGGEAREQIAKAKELYAAAAYEEALAVLDKSPAGDGVELVEYRILCLLALGKTDDAQLAIDTLLLVQPSYKPTASLMSPRMQTEFAAARERIIRRRYAEAKSTFDAKDYRTAAVRFDRVLAVLMDSPAQGDLADLKMLSAGFRDLARVMSADRGTSPVAGNAASTQAVAPTTERRGSELAAHPSTEGTFQGAVDGIYDASAGDVVPPVPLKPILPPVAPNQVVPVPSPGLFEVVIDEKGRVESVVVRRSVNPQYDALLAKDARGWRYRPATRDGRPVKFRKIIEIYSTSLRSIKR